MAQGGGRSEDFELANRRASAVSLAYNLCSTLLKIVGAVLTGSVSLLSEAIHSSTDVVSSLMAFIGVRAAAVPPDEEHPYGHGKIESLAGFGESILLFLVVVYIVVESVQRLMTGAVIESVDAGLAIMSVTALGSLLVSRFVLGTSQRTRSLALRSNGLHLVADFVTSLGVLLALGLVRFAGWTQADSIIALALALWIGWNAQRLMRAAFHELIDARLDPADLAAIEACLAAEAGLHSFHRLRTRRSGLMRYVDVHIVVPNQWSLVEAHAVADRLEKLIEDRLAPAQVVIHVDPFDVVKAGP